MKRMATCLSTLLLASMAHGEVAVSKLFTPHMVLQRGMEAPVYGTADPGEKVEVKFRSQSKTATADKEGRWLVKLESLEAGGPDVLAIGDRKIEDVLVGDVWIGSGQSNMQQAASAYLGGDPVLAAASGETYPKIRLMSQGSKDGWKEATPENIGRFSAQGSDTREG